LINRQIFCSNSLNYFSYYISLRSLNYVQILRGCFNIFFWLVKEVLQLLKNMCIQFLIYYFPRKTIDTQYLIWVTGSVLNKFQQCQYIIGYTWTTSADFPTLICRNVKFVTICQANSASKRKNLKFLFSQN